jgi:hypothetical protein
MTNEEFERLKAAEKEHLRAKKKLQDTLKSLRRNQQVRGAVDRLARSAQSALDRASDLIGQLTSETARDEARLEMALDDEPRDAAAPADPDVEAYEAKQDADRARDLVRKMKQAQRVPPPPVPSKPSGRTGRSKKTSDNASGRATSSADDLSTSPSSTDDDLPDKTIGRMR